MSSTRQSRSNDLQQFSLFDDGAFAAQTTRQPAATFAAAPALTYVAVDLEAEKALSTAEEAALWDLDPLSAYVQWMGTRRAHAREFNQHSVNQYKSMLGGYIRWLGESTERTLLTATVREIDRFLESKAGRRTKAGVETPASATTRRRYMHLLFGVYAHLVDIKVLGHNPVESLVESNKTQAYKRPAPTILSEALMKRFIDWTLARDTTSWVEARDKAMRLLFLATGVTVGELQRLRPADLHTGDTLTIDIASHGFVPQHAVPVAAFARESVLSWAERLNVLAPDSEWLFPARYFGFKIDRPDTMTVSSPECYTTIQASLNEIGYERERQGPQTLRNSFIAHQIFVGIDLSRITEWLGLKTNETAVKIKSLVPLRADGVVPA